MGAAGQAAAVGQAGQLGEGAGGGGQVPVGVVGLMAFLQTNIGRVDRQLMSFQAPLIAPGLRKKN